MRQGRQPAVRLILLFVLVAGLTPTWAHADDDSPRQPLRHRATAVFVPIGMVYSSGAMFINQRRMQGHQPIWDGDRVETPAGDMANIWLDRVGQLTLAGGTSVRLAAKPAPLDEAHSGHVLVASLVQAEMAVRLDQEASAYIEAGRSAYTASPGASFRMEVREGEAVIDEVRGAVRLESQRKIVSIKPRAVNARGVTIPNDALKVKTSEKKPFYILWEKIYGTSTTRLVAYVPGEMPASRERAQPAQAITVGANRIVRFAVKPQGAGEIVDQNGRSLTEARTNAQGIVTDVFFRARNQPGDAEIVANIDITLDELNDPETRTTAEAYTRAVSISKPGFWRTRNRLIMAAAAAAVITCCVIPHDHKPPLKQIPPPIIP
jgi:hypothetical protein